MKTIKLTLGVVLLLCLDVWTARGAVGTGPSGAGSTTVYNVFSTNNNQFVTNLIQSLDLWTNDVPAATGERAIRPVDQTRTVQGSIVGTNSYGLAFDFTPTNIPSGFSVGGYLFNHAANSAIGALTWQLSKYGFVGESSDANSVLTSGDTAGVLGVADGSFNLQYGTIGLGWSQKDGQSSVGIAGVATSDGHGSPIRTAGYFYNFLQSPVGYHFTPLLGNVVTINDSGVTGDDLAWWMTNTTSILVKINAAGDPVILNNASAGYLFTCMDGTGIGKWQPGNVIATNQSNAGVTNIILSVVSNSFGVFGNGHTNFISKFTPNTNTVGDSSLWNRFFNSIELFGNASGTAFTNSGTNAIYGEWTSDSNFQRLEMVAPKGHNNESAHLRVVTVGQTAQRADIVINDAWSFEPGTDPVSGHTAVNINPKVDNGGRIGSGSARVKGITVGTGNIVLGNSSSQPSFQVGSDAGIDGDANSLSFWRPTTGITAAFDRFNNLFLLDLGANGIAFGASLSNGISFVYPSTIAGLVQIGTNSGSATPASVGVMGAQGSGTDKGGADMRVIGGPSTGTGTNGNVRLQTAEKALASSTSLNSSFKDRLIAIADPIILTTNAATVVLNMTIPTALKGAGGMVIAHTEIEDGVNMATLDETFMISANRKGSTVVAGTPSAPVSSPSTSGGSAAIANTWTLVANAQSVDLKCTCVTSGILSTNSTVRVTFLPNSSAVPVITHP